MYSTDEIEEQISRLKQQITDTESQLSNLHLQLQQAEAKARAAQDLEIAHQGGVPHAWRHEAYEVFSHLFPTAFDPPSVGTNNSGSSPTNTDRRWPLSADDYRRYGRQLIVPEVGLQGQIRLKASKVLVVGAGGLGSPAAAYLAGAGVGNLGIMDGDTVELSNLHRQVAHSTSRIGKPKVESAITYLKELNPKIRYIPHDHHLTPEEAVDLFQQYDVILDCTDHPTSRYLISDACVLTGRPLVSASALRTEGQLIVLNNPPKPPGDTTGSPCYRCIWPTPPPPDTVVSCGEGGILGPVVGVMGVLQALEAIKVITSTPTIDSLMNGQDTPPSLPTLHMFSAYNQTPFRSVRIRARRKDCAACSPTATVKLESLTSGSLDYIAFCGVTEPVNILENYERVDAYDLAQHIPEEGQNISIVDVRPSSEFELCKIDGSINIPWTDFASTIKRAQQEPAPWLNKKNVVLVCRMGNDSQKAVSMIKNAGLAKGNVVDMRDGFRAWRQKVDPSWPDY
ncbi:molybdenum cofactor synthesis protein-like protein [Elsinoe ampelina]|uniref:Adenylyltransferase and sulfurtransferase uba4 n=1 Tax=Elsinoe ampelina TaxID=302913 RepID=A0A6A6FYE7_9PEZI|nr:molybdenum cofactor synthesis protein-like protein [Elsinoe ampelina]